MYVIRISNLQKVYKLYGSPRDRVKEILSFGRASYHNDFYALKDINLEIKKGEIVGILGQNGCGKSTLLKLISGVLTPSKGHVDVRGNISALLELGMGFNQELSGHENIFFNGMLLGYTEQHLRQKYNEIVEFADIGEHLFQPVKTYSSGMVARLAFSIAVNLDPEILVVDEALSVGDARFQQKAIRKMEELISKSHAILFVSHSIDTIKRFCTRAIWIKDGTICMDGPANEVSRNYYSWMTTGHTTKKLVEDAPADIVYNLTHQTGGLNQIEWEPANLGSRTKLSGTDLISYALISNSSTSKLKIFQGGEKVNLYLKFHIKDDVRSPSVGFNIYNELGLNVFGIWSRHFERTFAPLTRDSHFNIRIEFDMPNLLNGNYTMTVGLSDVPDPTNKINLIQVHEAIVFKISSSDIKQAHSSILIPTEAYFVESIEQSQ